MCMWVFSIHENWNHMKWEKLRESQRTILHYTVNKVTVFPSTSLTHSVPFITIARAVQYSAMLSLFNAMCGILDWPRYIRIDFPLWAFNANVAPNHHHHHHLNCIHLHSKLAYCVQNIFYYGLVAYALRTTYTECYWSHLCWAWICLLLFYSIRIHTYKHTHRNPNVLKPIGESRATQTHILHFMLLLSTRYTYILYYIFI